MLLICAISPWFSDALSPFRRFFKFSRPSLSRHLSPNIYLVFFCWRINSSSDSQSICFGTLSILSMISIAFYTSCALSSPIKV